MKVEVGVYERPADCGYRGWVEVGDFVTFLGNDGTLSVVDRRTKDRDPVIIGK